MPANSVGDHRFCDRPSFILMRRIFGHEMVGVNPAETRCAGFEFSCLGAILHMPEEVDETSGIAFYADMDSARNIGG